MTPDLRSIRSFATLVSWLEDELGSLARDEKPWIRDLCGRLVTFCRAADRAPDVLFAWSLR